MKYKHKYLQLTAETLSEGGQVVVNGIGKDHWVIAKKAFEQSNDWEQLEVSKYPVGTKLRSREGRYFEKTPDNLSNIHHSEWTRNLDSLYVNISDNLIGEGMPFSVFYDKLWTTEDGVDIHTGDSYWLWKLTSKNNYPHRNKAAKAHDSNEIKTFSTEEAAKEYIRKNALLLSFNDIDKVSIHFEDKVFLNELINSRLL